jgi:hypothetical protein
MDQFYWYVDEDTLIGYQAPVALVAIKPERVVLDPVLVWDFGFIPEAAPTLSRYFIADSDDFFMIEPQSRDAGDDMIRIGWASFDEVARARSMYLTKEQRESGTQLLKFHAADLPADIDDVINESRAYLAEVDRRLSPIPASHVDHPLLGRWFRETTLRRQAVAEVAPPQSNSQDKSGKVVVGLRPASHSSLLGRLQTIYHKTFGSPPRVGQFHPLWADTSPMAQAVTAWSGSGQPILWVSSSVSLLQSLGGAHVDLARVLGAELGDTIERQAPYDACICELNLVELLKIEQLYAKVRPLVKDGGHVLVYVAKRGRVFEGAHLLLQEVVFPSVDVSQIHFWGDAATRFLAMLYLRASAAFQSMPIARALTVGATLLLLAPIVRLANARATRRDSTTFRPTWTSLTIEFTVKRAASAARKA